MARKFGIFFTIFCILSTSCLGDWNILSQHKTNSDLQISLKNYCESWRMNVELHNIRDYVVVPQECVAYIGKYMTSTQYKVDSERTINECILYISTNCILENDGKDAWIFDIDDTLLSSVPYYKKNGFGGNKLNMTSLEDWMSQGKGTALEHSLKLFNHLKELGVQIFLVSSRREHLRSATVDNLVKVDFYGWNSLILRDQEDECKNAQTFKAEIRSKLISQGYRIVGIVGDQWSSINGLPSAKRSFKLPNPMYYVA
ncbi:acid phosphatase 1-like [Solanum pennellii]|uniref:Acid phosphatase 1-like n=1 Tax=Solanum pennellii TaxID=28526 RepID=A0ABM1HKG2_SOLPN|nr:acid phosphatase 1-like [Solanum pennellii]